MKGYDTQVLSYTVSTETKVITKKRDKKDLQIGFPFEKFSRERLT